MLVLVMRSGNGYTTRCTYWLIGFGKSTDDDSAYEVLLGVVIGGLLGYSARKVMKFAERKKLIDRQSYVAQYVSLAVLSIGKYREGNKDPTDLQVFRPC
jgi:hypothetical protein